MYLYLFKKCIDEQYFISSEELDNSVLKAAQEAKLIHSEPMLQVMIVLPGFKKKEQTTFIFFLV